MRLYLHTSAISSSDLHSNGVYYFEFLEKVFDGQCDVEIMV